ncbi:TMEM175 family protein [Amycolatopsis sp. CA-230715]|uniref:TMEM175 family protein n=1 Tax=Amycolatopsis sp. CA-230715 TaxID=2745196 RepID=UPI001C01A0B2|nr:TMEM175 family protein [Amycolatopsis sp. CA-230715]QWF83437.1 hypothetical protein HUW46_06878 [Amycolatopsis sp. CA-230715]
MRTSQGQERLVFFTDAVVAIAITLLVLPLVDAVPEALGKHHESTEVLSENLPLIYSFLLSFAVIARLWRVHHKLFQHVGALSEPVVLWNTLWVLTIVVLPFPTEMIGAYGNDRFTAVFYIGTMLASSLCQTTLTVIVWRNPALAVEGNPLPARFLHSSVSTAAALLVAVLLVAFVPGVTYYALFLLLLPPLVERLLGRRKTAA